MPDYHAMYLRLFNAQTDALKALNDTSAMLVQSHQAVEEMLLDAPEDNLAVLPSQKAPGEKDD